MAGVQPEIHLVLRMVLPDEVVTPIPAALGRQTHFTVEAAHGVAAADGEFVQGGERGVVPLDMQAGVVGECLFAEMKGLVEADVGGEDAHAGSAFVEHFFWGAQGIGHTGAAFVV